MKINQKHQKTKKSQSLKRTAKRPAAIVSGRDKTQISISLPTALLKQVDERAGHENRNRSNFIAVVIERALDGANTLPSRFLRQKSSRAAPKGVPGKWMRHTPDQIEKALKDFSNDISAKEVCAKHGISMPTLFRWRKSHG